MSKNDRFSISKKSLNSICFKKEGVWLILLTHDLKESRSDWRMRSAGNLFQRIRRSISNSLSNLNDFFFFFFRDSLKMFLNGKNYTHIVFNK